MTGAGPSDEQPGDPVTQSNGPGADTGEGADLFDVIIEIPAGTRNKYELDLASGLLRLERQLPANMVYPADYGLFPETLAEDGDPVDALVLIDEPAVPGCVVRVQPLGLLRVRDEHGPDPKVICVLAERAERDHLQGLNDLPRRTLDELEHFFAVYKDLDTGRWAATDGFGPREEALAEITAGWRRAAEARSAGGS